jgi:hypothetical protein
MNHIHLHLWMAHLPILFSALGGLAFVIAIWKKSYKFMIASYIFFILIMVGASFSYFSGDGAAEVVRNIPGIPEAMIWRHETFAGIAMLALIILGLVSIAALYITMKRSGFTGMMTWIIACIVFISFALLGATAHFGGKLKHARVDSETRSEAHSNTINTIPK